MFSRSTTKTVLKSGIKIDLRNAINQVDRLSINNGTIEVDPDLYPQYSHPAFIPKSPWRQLTDLEQKLLLDLVNPVDVSQTIAIVKFPESAINPLRNLIRWGENEYGEMVQASEIINHPEYYSAREDICNYILQQYAIDTDLNCRELIRCELDLSTTTINGIEFLPAKLFAGMHLDSWDYRPFRLRHLARNRICINLGREIRYFLLINRTLQQVFNDLNLVDPDDIYQDYRGVRLSLKFLRALPEYPVIRLGIYPGEAYIAPTENFIHDATSIGKTVPDWSMTFLGKFTIPC
jgi:hypothetical protein